jgi:hypothetical protein
MNWGSSLRLTLVKKCQRSNVDLTLNLDCIEPLANHLDLSLRQLEKVYTNLAVFYGSSSENHFKLVPVVVFLSVVKVVDPPLFDQLLHQKASFGEVTNQLNIHHLNEETENNRKLFGLMSWVRYALLSEQEFKELPEEDKIKRYGNSMWEYNISRERLIPIFAQQQSMFVVK